MLFCALTFKTLVVLALTGVDLSSASTVLLARVELSHLVVHTHLLTTSQQCNAGPERCFQTTTRVPAHMQQDTVTHAPGHRHTHQDTVHIQPDITKHTRKRCSSALARLGRSDCACERCKSGASSPWKREEDDLIQSSCEVSHHVKSLFWGPRLMRCCMHCTFSSLLLTAVEDGCKWADRRVKTAQFMYVSMMPSTPVLLLHSQERKCRAQ